MQTDGQQNGISPKVGVGVQSEKLLGPLDTIERAHALRTGLEPFVNAVHVEVVAAAAFDNAAIITSICAIWRFEAVFSAIFRDMYI